MHKTAVKNLNLTIYKCMLSLTQTKLKLHIQTWFVIRGLSYLANARYQVIRSHPDKELIVIIDSVSKVKSQLTTRQQLDGINK